MKFRNLAAGLTFALAFSLAVLSPRPVLDNSVEAWLPQNNSGLERYHRFRADFGSDEVVLVQLTHKDQKPEKRLAQIVKITETLEELEIVSGVMSASTIFSDEVDILSDQRFGAFNDRNWKKLQHSFYGPLNQSLKLFEPDLKEGQDHIYVTLKPGASETRKGVEEALKTFLKRDSPSQSVRVASFALVNLELDRASIAVEQESMPLLVVLSVLLVLLITRSPGMTAAVFIPVGLGVFASEGLLGLAGETSNLIVTIVKPMLFVLILAGGLHIVVYFQSLPNPENKALAELAWSAAWGKTKPCLIAFATTALGFASLGVADVIPVKIFGLLTAASLILAALLVLVLLPGFLALISRLPLPSLLQLKIHQANQGPDFMGRLALKLTNIGEGAPLLFVSLALLALPTAAWSFTQLTVEPHAINYFPKDHPLRSDHESIEKSGRGLANLELIIEGDQNLLAKSKNRRDFFQSLDLFLNKSLTVPGVLGRIDPALLLRESGYQSAKLDSIPANYFLDDSLEELDLIANGSASKDGRQLRATLFMKTLDADQIAEVKRQLNAHFNEVFKGQKSFQLSITGSYDLLLKTQKSLLTTLQQSLLMTALLIELILLLALKSWRLALLSILPNSLPVAGNFILMMSLEMSLDVGTTMTAAIALGIAVDDTIHFLSSWQKKGLEKASLDTGKAIVLSSLIIGAGFASLLSSNFSPTRAFGLLCVNAMILALIGDLLVLPGLLKWFGPKTNLEAKSEPQA
ncbi:MAG: efflux RND transporter permease subunit [Planctomycetota bacterium]|nr:efflux RND transporter permease subunit [Planctomycetota bacterium]